MHSTSELALCSGEGRRLRMPCRIYECVLLIALVALREDSVCLGLKQGKSNRGIRRGDRTKAVFTSLLRSCGHRTPLSQPLVTGGLSLQGGCVQERQPQPFPPRCRLYAERPGGSRPENPLPQALFSLTSLLSPSSSFSLFSFLSFLSLLPPLHPPLSPLSTFIPVCEPQICFLLSIEIARD